MKKISLTISAMMLIALSMQAQNKYWVNTSLYYIANSVDDNNSSSTNSYYSFTPQVGYLFNNKWGVGIKYGNTTYDNDYKFQNVHNGDTFTSNSHNKNSQQSIGVLVRRYISFGNVFSIIIQADANKSNGTSERGIESSGLNTMEKSTSKGINMTLSPILMLQLNEHWVTEFKFGDFIYSKSKENDDAGDRNERSQTNFSSNFGAYSAGIGLTYFF